MKLNSVILFSQNPQELVEFYAKVLETQPDWEGGQFKGFSLDEGMLFVGPHDAVSGPNTTPERIMFNLNVNDVESEFERLKDTDAKVVAKPYAPTQDQKSMIATFADPDNNYFQLVSGGSWAN